MNDKELINSLELRAFGVDLKAAKRIKELSQENAALRGKWISCEEKMPNAYNMVIVDGGYAYHKNGEWFSGTNDNPISWEVTHWMYFPRLPLPEGAEGL